ncbi:tyrosine-type recombinase/integrase [Xanthomonas arboricola]|uniref:tyrosine-type recombinase/integrase n=1 Tax=Xanthomonas arboricola TaxID=56448 RepID=UPI000E1F7D7B|nr:tyrosine-type recombinase/integrase [Xanthomonas arboricola]
MTVIRAYCSISEPALRERFVWFLQITGRSPETAKSYLRALARFDRFATDNPLDRSGIDVVHRYVGLRRDQVRPATVNIEVNALRCWFRWLAQNQPDAWQPASLPRCCRVPGRRVWALTDAEVGMLLAAPDLTTYVGFRDHVIMATLYQCGLRAGELAKLQVGSILPDGFLIVFGKGNKERLVPIGEHCVGLLHTYLRERGKLRPGKKNALFLTVQGHALRDARSVWVIVRKYANALGYGHGGAVAALDATISTKPWTGHYPHRLRTAFATELHRRGVNLMALSQLLGHASVVTTALYLGIDMAQLREAVAHHPRSKRVSD